MPLPRFVPPRFLVAAALLALDGCAGPTPDREPARPMVRLSTEEEIGRARRDERQRIMQEYWFEHTVVAEHGTPAASELRPTLSYPGGVYGGIRFAPRQAADPSLAEPDR